MPCRGIRGATTVETDSAAAILAATRELLTRIVEANDVAIEDIASAFFTVTPDLTSAFPAQAARELGWRHVALLDAQEMAVPGSLPRCVRVLIHWNTDKPQAEICHVYLRDAVSLRQDLENGGESNDQRGFSGGERSLFRRSHLSVLWPRGRNAALPEL